MEKEHIKDLIPQYLDNLLEGDIKNKVENHISVCEDCTSELEKLKVLFKAFEQEEKAIPPNSIRNTFFEQLALEKQNTAKVVPLHENPLSRRKNWMGNLLKLAASVALLLGSYMLGKYQEGQKSSIEIAAAESKNTDMKQIAMISLMENKSASKRIQGVNYIDEFENPDPVIVKALSERMLYDENTNVRLNAVDALARFTKSEIVKSTFIEALRTEKDPSIQITIIQVLVKIQEKKALKPLRQLLEREDTQPFVKQQIESLLPSII